MNLNRTFAHAEDKAVEDEVARRLSRFEEELATAATEFADGVARISEPVPVLDDAIDAMREASTLLGSKDLASARPLEEKALASLIKARKNMRKFLSQKNSPSSSACRTFDRKQEQKIRRPPADTTKDELAKLEGDLQQLAQTEKKFSEEIEAQGGGGAKLDPPQEPPHQPPQESRSSSSSSSQAESQKPSDSKPQPKPGPAERQQAAAVEARRLQDLAHNDEALSDLARKRMEEAAKAVEDAYQAMQSGRPRDAAEQAGEAAEKLDRLARQVGGLKGRELSSRLAKARELAQKLAKEEQGLGEELKAEASRDDVPESGTRQEGLAEEAATLGDLLKRLWTDAAEEDRALSQAIGRASEANAPAEIEQDMRRVASALDSGRREQAAREAGGVARRLDALALDLESARRGHVQPQLDRLLAAETQAAAVQKALLSVQKEAQKAEAEKAMTDLSRSLEKLPAEGPLRQAIDAVARAVQDGNSRWNDAKGELMLPTGVFTPPVDYSNGLNRVITALQAQIQELILDEAMVDRDGAVPLQYKALVEDYYRVLSQDLR